MTVRQNERCRRVMLSLCSNDQAAYHQVMRLAKKAALLYDVDPEQRLPNGLLIGSSPRAIVQLAELGNWHFGDTMPLPKLRHPPLKLVARAA